MKKPKRAKSKLKLEPGNTCKNVGIKTLYIAKTAQGQHSSSLKLHPQWVKLRITNIVSSTRQRNLKTKDKGHLGGRLLGLPGLVSSGCSSGWRGLWLLGLGLVVGGG